ncbi:MAG: 3-methyl-2-oxobutanoate hydroxymethyltransferase [Bacteroidaceae bacterium]|jgi:3-methyl-2-oxobutanoate hydroxymethyltransferase|nr:3-methyl-2-oxobutanoate hydroxymethyltransferase [Bacteroidaceae bacterium]
MAAYLVEDQKKITTGTLRKMKQEGQKIAMLTSYDFGTARIVDEAGIDIILVGDSAANVMAGHATTLPITVDEMIYHAKCVVRGVKRAFVVCDMPFGSYQISTEDGVRNAVKIMKESGADGVKLEGGAEIIDTVKRIIAAGIPVMGHLGLTPQSINVFGNYSVRAKEEAEAQKLIDDAKALEAAGCFAIVVEKIPATLTQKVMQQVNIPIIGIGGGQADGQVLVVDDLLGKNPGFKPKFLRQYADLHTIMTNAINQYVADVKSTDFPNVNEQY